MEWTTGQIGRRRRAPRTHRRAAGGLLLGLLLAPLGAPLPGEEIGALVSPVGQLVRLTLEGAAVSGRLEAGGVRLYARELLTRFYGERGFAPAWTMDGGLLQGVEPAVRTIAAAGALGLRPEDYHLAAIRRLLSIIYRRLDDGVALSPRHLAELDLLLTDAVLVYAEHAATGKTDPKTIHSDWGGVRPDFDAVGLLTAALAAADLEAVLAHLEPTASGYRRLKERLARLRRTTAAGPWPVFPAGPVIRPGEASPRVPALRARLEASGDLPAPVPAPDPALYDPELAAAVRRFQARTGLEPDGVVGGRTAAELAVPLSRRVDQVLANLERWRWLPNDLGPRHLEVNIAGFALRVVEDDRTVFASRVIVGKRYTRTPVFSARLTYLVINPYWNIPDSIAGSEILPKTQEDPGYLPREGIRVFTDSGPGAIELDPAAVDWARLTAQSFPYFLRQDPGPKNALGRIKLMLPNPYDVYLHDTPEKHLFELVRRSFSHGCIRVEKPIELAAFLLRDDPAWTEETIRAAIASGEQRTLLLPRPIPVHILYWTAWVDEEGRLQLRDDLYGRDEPIERALRRPPPR